MTMFGPKCPKCGRRCTPTGYSLPFPIWRCTFCIYESRKNASRENLEYEVQMLKNRVKTLEKELDK